MNEVEWMRNPKNGRLLGHIFIRNMHLYSSGRNLDVLDRNIKQQGAVHHIPSSLLRLSLKPVDKIDFSYASKMFVKKYVDKIDMRFLDATEAKRMINITQENTRELHCEDLNDIPPVVEDEDCSYITKQVDGNIFVYKVVKVAEYKMFEQPIEVKHVVPQMTPFADKVMLNE